MHIVLHVGHRMGKDAHVQRVTLLAADVVPDLREQVASGLTLTSVVVQLHALSDPGDRRIGDPQLFLRRLVSRQSDDRSRANNDDPVTPACGADR
ncbi:hypothetical protein [Streptomyces sp. 8K308]|uniref:hypothetical protein n=1 Tax=Streptomyces sp. 8K308 TaxID=2530388 RepID=UPI0014052ABE|nr:hypothetical protein [Streptomyces sp. 8K308]